MTPRAIDTDGKTLWVVDKGSARIQRLDPMTGKCLQWWSMPKFELGKPTGLTIGPTPGDSDPTHQSLWVADTHYNRVMVYALPEMPAKATAETTGPMFVPAQPPIEPRLVASFGTYGKGPGEFIYLTDVAILPDARGGIERVYVSEYGGNDRVSVFDGSLKFLFSFGRCGSGASASDVQFDRPQSLAIDPASRELLIADARNHRVGRFTLDGALLAWYGGPDKVGREPGRFNYPWAILPLGDGTAMVTEHGNCRLQRIELKTGASVWMGGRPGRGVGELAEPWASVVLDGRMYTLDTANNRVVVTAARRAN